MEKVMQLKHELSAIKKKNEAECAKKVGEILKKYNCMPLQLISIETLNGNTTVPVDSLLKGKQSIIFISQE